MSRFPTLVLFVHVKHMSLERSHDTQSNDIH
jgi:hypothetical protein